MPVSGIMHGEYGIEDVSLSMPAVVGKHGIEAKVPILLNELERSRLEQSADTLKDIMPDCYAKFEDIVETYGSSVGGDGNGNGGLMPNNNFEQFTTKVVSSRMNDDFLGA